MDSKTFARLVSDLREDPDLFHAFIFAPGKALKALPYLDEVVARRLRTADSLSFIADATGLLEPESATGGCGPDTTCSCTNATCGGVTCGGSTCDVTCTANSCGNTCGDSCGMTTNGVFTGHGPGMPTGAKSEWDDAYIMWDWSTR
jgi:hypothetical protein